MSEELPGISGDYISTPDNKDNRITGDITVEVEFWPRLNGIIIQEYEHYFKMIYPTDFRRS